MSSEPFEASVAIWKGMRPVANGGWITMSDQQVDLFDTKGNPLASGSTATTYAKPKRGTMGSGMAVWIDGQKFMLSPGSGNRPDIRVVPGTSNPGLGMGASAVAHGREFAAEFYDALEAAGGHKGEPPK